MKIDFYIDYDEDLRYVLARLTRLDPAGLENRLKDKEIDIEVVKNILNAPNEQEKTTVLNKFLKDYYEENSLNFGKVKSEYIKIWKDKVNTFFSVTSEIMGSRKWNYDNYRFLVSSFFFKGTMGRGK